MKRLKLVSLCGCLLLALASCTNDDCMSQDVQFESVESPVFSDLSDILNKIVSDETTQCEVYILFDSSDGSFNVMSEEEYMFCNSIAEFMSNDSNPKKAPEGNGWRNGGTYKNRLDGAMKAVNKLKKEISADQDFELHVERNGDGTFTIWWRPV